jgi:hypothetical protein
MSTRCSLKRTALMLAVVAMATVPAAKSYARQPHIAPIQSHPYGQTYSEWAADWWQFVLETPASVNPVLDTTGADCDQGDMGNVWFLFGFLGGDPIERSCEIPVGTALFFPLINQVSARFEGETTTEQELRAQAACVEDAATTLLFEFNGDPVSDLDRFFEESVVFQAQFPDSDALLGLDGVFVDLGVDAGFYLLLRPLPPGDYDLHWEAAACGATQDITYHLTIRPGRRV